MPDARYYSVWDAGHRNPSRTWTEIEERVSRALREQKRRALAERFYEKYKRTGRYVPMRVRSSY